MTTEEQKLAMPISKGFLIQQYRAVISQLKNTNGLTEWDHSAFCQIMDIAMTGMSRGSLPGDVQNELLAILLTDRIEVVNAKKMVKQYEFDAYSQRIQPQDEDFLSQESFSKIDIADTLKSIMFEILAEHLHKNLSNLFCKSNNKSDFLIKLNKFIEVNNSQQSITENEH